MADVKPEYGGTSATAITCTLASLANASARECTVIDNTSDLFLDAFVKVNVKLATGTPAASLAVNVYAYGASESSTPTYPDKVTGSNAGITLDSPTNLRLLGIIQAATSGALTFKGGPWSVCQALGLPVLPPKWGIVVQNLTNLALDSTEGNHLKVFMGIRQSVA